MSWVRPFSVLVMLMSPIVSCAANTVTLQFTDGDATPTSAFVIPGHTFTVSLQLKSNTANSGDQVTGVDYNLQAPNNTVFTIMSRNSQTVGSSFPEVYVTDASVANTPLTPREAANLGGGKTDVSTPASNGTFEVADYTILVNAGTPSGTYALTAYAPTPSLGYAGPGPGFTETNFASIGSFSVTVPEPASIGLVGITTVLLLRRRSTHRQHTTAGLVS